MYDRYFDIGVKNLVDLSNNKKKVVLWGQGRRLAMLFGSYTELVDTNFFYVDNSLAKWGQKFFDLYIRNPEELIEFDPDILIVAVGDANLNIVLDKINVLSKSAKFDLTERVILLGELFDERRKFTI